MTRVRNRIKMIALLAMVLGFAAFGATTVRADDPLPIDPTLGGGGVTPLATSVSPEAWAEIEALVLAAFPDADYATICYYAEVWFYALPPDYSTLPADPITQTLP